MHRFHQEQPWVVSSRMPSPPNRMLLLLAGRHPADSAAAEEQKPTVLAPGVLPPFGVEPAFLVLSLCSTSR